MTDRFGKELNVGDEVAYVQGKNSDACIAKGTVKKIYKNRYNKDECTIDSQTHVLSFRVMKLND